MRIISIAARNLRWRIAGRGAARGRSERAAMLIEVRSAYGVIGLGEAAPLPGMSSEQLEDIEQALGDFARFLPFDVAYGGSAAVPFEIMRRDAAQRLSAAPAAARFAIETALCDAIGRERSVPMAALLAPGGDPARYVPLAAVVDDPESARRAQAAGVRCFKIKLDARDSFDRVTAIAAAVPHAALRIDANRSWPRAEVAARLAALAAFPIDYVEEPCRDAHQLLSAPLPCRIALDESLASLPADARLAALRSPGLAAVVLKPTLLGGLAAALELAALARSFGVAAVASHTLEGPIGTAACAELALALAADPTTRATGGPPAGLTPHTALASWRIPVAQIAADHIHPAPAPGLGFADLDLGGLVQACGLPSR